MKKLIFTLFAGALLAFVISGSLVSCSKKSSSTTPPTITLTGSNNISLNSNNGVYKDPGYTASDPADGDITSKVVVNSSAVNVNLKGAYPVSYSVTDAAGNTATASRIVAVVNDADFLAGTYTGNDGSNFSTNVQVTTSTTTNNKFTISAWGANSSPINNITLLTPTSPFTQGGSTDTISKSPLKILGAASGIIFKTPLPIVIQFNNYSYTMPPSNTTYYANVKFTHN